MAKYDPLARLLRAATTNSVRASFAELDVLVGGLPRSARIHAVWWSNEVGGRHVQAHAWTIAGFKVDAVDMSREVVTFTRRP